MKTLVGLSLILLPALATADERGSYVTLDRAGTDDVIGLAVSAHFSPDAGTPDLALRENLYGRYVDSSGFGVYGQMSIAHAFGNGNSASAIGGIEVGGLYVAKLGGFDVVTRFGIGLPTAPDDIDGLLTNTMGIVDRIEDVALIDPHALSLRPGVALRFGDHSLFGQVDGGVDAMIPVDGGRIPSLLFHASAGLGTYAGPIAFTGEVASFFADSNGFYHYHSFAASARYAHGPLQPYVAYALTRLYSDPADATLHSVTAGVQGTF